MAAGAKIDVVRMTIDDVDKRLDILGQTQLDVDIEKQQCLNNSIDELCRQVEILKASQRAAKK